MNRTQVERKLAKVTERLEYYYEKEKALLSNDGVQSYTIGSRSVTRYQYSSNIMKQIEELEKQRDELENLLDSKKPRKSVGVVLRDW